MSYDAISHDPSAKIARVTPGRAMFWADFVCLGQRLSQQVCWNHHFAETRSRKLVFISSIGCLTEDRGYGSLRPVMFVAMSIKVPMSRV